MGQCDKNCHVTLSWVHDVRCGGAHVVLAMGPSAPSYGALPTSEEPHTPSPAGRRQDGYVVTMCPEGVRQRSSSPMALLWDVAGPWTWTRDYGSWHLRLAWHCYP